MVIIVLFGAPGSGKGTQSELLVNEFGYTRISTGDVIRSEINAGSVLGKLTKEFQSKGQLVPDELVDEMVGNLLSSSVNELGLVFDGYPRTVSQCRTLDSMVSNISGENQVFFIYLNASLSELSSRIASRILCSSCSSVFSRDLGFSPGSVCPHCMGLLTVRADDSADIVASRFSVFLKELDPILSFYGDRLKEVSADGSAVHVYNQIKKVIYS